MVHWNNSDEYEILSANQVIRWEFSYDPENGEKYIKRNAKDVYRDE